MTPRIARSSGTRASTSGDTFRHFAKLARTRSTYEALRRGDHERRLVERPRRRRGRRRHLRVRADVRRRRRSPMLSSSSYSRSRRTADRGRREGHDPHGRRVGSTLVDILNPERESYSVPANGELRVTVSKQSAMILVPENDAKD